MTCATSHLESLLKLLLPGNLLFKCNFCWFIFIPNTLSEERNSLFSIGLTSMWYTFSVNASLRTTLNFLFCLLFSTTYQLKKHWQKVLLSQLHTHTHTHNVTHCVVMIARGRGFFLLMKWKMNIFIIQKVCPILYIPTAQVAHLESKGKCQNWVRYSACDLNWVFDNAQPLELAM